MSAKNAKTNSDKQTSIIKTGRKRKTE